MIFKFRFLLVVLGWQLTIIKFSLKNPDEEWSLKNAFFTYTKGVEVTVERTLKYLKKHLLLRVSHVMSSVQAQILT